MNVIASVDKNWGIGKDNKLLVSIPSDMKLFRKRTLNKIVVAGRKTVKTFQNGKPLMDRTNIVLSNQSDLAIDNAEVAHSVEDVLSKLEGLYRKGYSAEDVFIVGGASVFRQMLPYCSRAYITKIDCAYEADAYFPDLDELPDWRLVEQSEEKTYFDLEYTFLIYEKNLSA